MICFYAILYDMLLLCNIWYASILYYMICFYSAIYDMLLLCNIWYASMLYYMICFYSTTYDMLLCYIIKHLEIRFQVRLYVMVFGFCLHKCDSSSFSSMPWLVQVTVTLSASLPLCHCLSLTFYLYLFDTIAHNQIHTHTHTHSLTQILNQHTHTNTRALTLTLTPPIYYTHYFWFAFFSLGAQYSYKSRSSFRRGLQISRRGTRKVRFFFHFLLFSIGHFLNFIASLSPTFYFIWPYDILHYS